MWAAMAGGTLQGRWPTNEETAMSDVARTAMWRPVNPRARVIAILAITGIAIVGFSLRSTPALAKCVAGTQTAYCDYYWFRPGFLWHIGGSLAAASIGLVQIWLGITGRARAMHRLLGRAYLVMVVSGGTGSLLLLCTLPEPANEPYRYGLISATVAWMLTAGLGFRAARLRHFAVHRQWMTRSFVIAMLFVIFRSIDRSVRVFNPDWFAANGDALENVLAWATWCVPLLLLEIYHRQARRVSRQ
jgi:uncharacterized membrane protein